ncbi:hypothetical protein FHS15_002318 [Paenibacillus castaneae]|uniref:S-layer homology domain-containing protein n=1 Tax=Paenibacillus castaneae TaxID=474957 RepID=UPI000C99C401|nr:S-layer homology domain-containing protein [Paenibacillus castaneae]NIK77193.1 hypothetical protein [Paenibacillus castaneae]
MQVLKRSIMIITMVLFLFSGIMTQHMSAREPVSAAYETASAYMVKNVPNPTYNNEWFIISLARGGYKVPAHYYENYYTNLVKEVQERKGELHSRKYTEYSRVILALSAIGKDARNVGGYNLVEKLYDFDQVKWQGLNGPIFALIALDSWQYDIPKTATNSRKEMIDYILDKQLDNGGFSLSGTQSDSDITAMAIQALSSYIDRADVKAAINKALAELSQSLLNKGKYENAETGNVENIAQLITALTSLSINPLMDDRFNGVFDGLFQFYYAADGGFKHQLTEKVSNGMATEQAAYAIAAYERMLAGKTKLYDMTDAKPRESSFSDISNHWGNEVIEQAFELGLMKGYEDGTFRPQVQLTRVQAASLIARTLKLQHTQDAPYSDIAKYNQATKDEIAAVFEAGIIQLNAAKFNPDHKLTRAELALMLVRGYQYKEGTKYEAAKPAPFSDIARFNDETKQAITFLYDLKLAEGSNGLFYPSAYTTRAEASKLFVNFYNLVK